MSSGRPRSVAIIGAGILGLATAYYLRRAGIEVTVFDRGLVGAGASSGNAGEICPSSSDPLPSPDMLREAAVHMFRPDSALYLHPAQLFGTAPFLAGFVRSATSRRYEAGLAAMDLLNRETLRCYDELAADGIGQAIRKDGYVSCFQTREVALAAHQQAVTLARRGLTAGPGELLDGAALRAVEPALSESARWGFVETGDRWTDPSVLLADLTRWLHDAGVQIRENTVVRRILPGPAGVTLRGFGEPHRCDAVVLAAGAWSDQLSRPLGVRLGVVPGKGYSFSVYPEVMPGHVLKLDEAHVAATPMGSRLRIAGTMEFDGTYDRMNYRRIEAIIRNARPYVAGVDWDNIGDEWVGPRPMTPDGLPHIGSLPGHPSVFAVTGHNMLGVSLGPSSASLVTKMITGAVPQSGYQAFSPGRFS